MTPERWRVVSRVYHDARALRPAEREAYVREACGGDEELRREVALLLAQPSGDDILSGSSSIETAPLTGLRIGPYELKALIGAGGMGEVYRARDSALGRDVAIKILPRRFTRDPDRLARFEREARSLAALNHPNIAAIYGVEEANGTRGLVLELVEGDTLAERVQRGPVAVPEALALARSIADALEAAHERGIVHRDLKPANIKVTPSGSVKVLDFGLAKITAQETPVAADAAAAPPAPPDTREGLVLGTLPYMSPEQARGRPVDRRTDIWAFACVLYELLTGRAAFAGETPQDTLAAVLEREPDATALPPGTPASARRLLARCFVKDPRHRLHDIADARLELDDSVRETATDRIGRPPASPASRRLAWALAALGCTAAAWLGIDRLRTRDGAGSADVLLQQLTFDAGLTTTPAVSPDGRLVAYASDRAGRGDLDIWIQQVDGGAPLRLTDDPADDLAPDFSPDGKQIAFRSERAGGGVYVVPTLGGLARLVVAEGRRPRFSPDGAHLAYWAGQFRGAVAQSESATFVVPLGGGSATRLAAGFQSLADPVWAPDGRSIVALGRRDRSAPVEASFDWWWLPLDGRPPVKTGTFDQPPLKGAGAVRGDGSPSAWTASGAIVSAGANLWSIPLSMRTGRPTGPAERLTIGTGVAQTPSAALDGAIVFADVRVRRVIERVPLGTGGEPTPVRLYEDQRRVALRASHTADGASIVFEQFFDSYREIWIRDVTSGHQQMVVRTERTVQPGASISPDGARIAYVVGASVENQADGYAIEVEGGVPRVVCSACGLYGFLSDNRRVLATWDEERVIGLIDTKDGSRVELIRAGDGHVNRPHASPDDRWLAFRHVTGQQGRVFVTALTPGRTARPESWQRVDQPTTTGRPCGWSPDSRTAYVLLDTDGFRCLWGQRLERDRLVGPVFPVHHFHGGQIDRGGPSTSLGNAVNALGFLYERTLNSGNIWRLTRQRAQAP